MIIKSFESEKIITGKHRVMLFYGSNEGFKKEVTKIISKNQKNIDIFEEKEILDNPEFFFNKILSKSLFENEKFIIIKRATDRILNTIEKIDKRELTDTTILINSENLEKKSKLRSYFEKSKKHICIAFYPDNMKTLLGLAHKFLRERAISLSQANINLIVEKCNEDRGQLINELTKIEYYNKNGKKINSRVIEKLINLVENHSISELADNCLAKNTKKTLQILNENNFLREDFIIIIRTLLSKSKKILVLINQYKNNNNIDLTIDAAKPPIFWKNKEIIKQQIYKWNIRTIRNLIYDLNNLELIIKKNFENSVNIITDFILEKSSSTSNN